MKIRKILKKGFTLVELVVVIAVIAILAAVSVGMYFGFTESAKKSNDQTVTSQMNKALMLDEQLDGKPTTPSEALAVLEENGFNVTKLSPYQDESYYLWDSVENQMILLNSNNEVQFPENTAIRSEYHKYFTFIASDEDKVEGRDYSYYLKDGYTGSMTFSTSVDAGKNASLGTIVIDTTLEEVLVATEVGDIKINNAVVVKQYGSAGFIDIVKVATDSFHAHGEADFINIKEGKLELEGTADIGAVHAEGSAKLVVKTGGKVGTITESSAGMFTVEGTTKTPEVQSKDDAMNESVVVRISNEAELDDFVTNSQKVNAELISSFTLTKQIKVSRKATLDLNGFEITFDYKGTDTFERAFGLKTGADFTVIGTKSGSKMTLSFTNTKVTGFFEVNQGDNNTKLTVIGGYYSGNANGGAFYRVYPDITGSEVTFKDVNAAVIAGAIQYIDSPTKAIVEGGTFMQQSSLDNLEDGYGVTGLPTPAFALYLTEGSFKNMTITSQYGDCLSVEYGTAYIDNVKGKVLTRILTNKVPEYNQAGLSISHEGKAVVSNSEFTGFYGCTIYSSGGYLEATNTVFEGIGTEGIDIGVVGAPDGKYSVNVDDETLKIVIS